MLAVMYDAIIRPLSYITLNIFHKGGSRIFRGGWLNSENGGNLAPVASNSVRKVGPVVPGAKAPWPLPLDAALISTVRPYCILKI